MNKKTRIAFLAGQLGLGGAERQLFYLLSGLPRDIFELRVLTLNPGYGDYWEAKIRELAIPLIEIPRFNRIYRAWSVRRVVRDWPADVIQSFHFHANGYGVLAAWPRSMPVVGAVRFLPNHQKAKAGWLFALWKRVCAKDVDRLVCNSQAAVRLLRQTHPKLTHTLAIPNGIVCPTEQELERLRREGRLKLARPEDEVIIGYVGRLDSNKNVALLIQAAAVLDVEHIKFHLVIVGDGPTRAHLSEAACRIGLQDRITFLGAHPFAERLIPTFDVLCLTSNSEGMPNTLMEAGAAGVPVVSTRVGGVPEVVCDGETGFLCSAGDADALALHLRRLIQDPTIRVQLGQAARMRMQQEFSVERMIKRYQELYLTLANKPQR